MILSAAIKAARRSHAHTSCLQYNSLGRSDSSCSSIVTELYCFLAKEWSDMLPFNDRVYTACHNIKRGILAEQIELDSIPVGNRENLQKVGYSGHKQRHCSLSTIRAFVPRMDCAYRILDLLKDDFMILQCCVRASCPPI
ncbi:hypothetical protein PC119_g13281 [Phytophthora cactorum]|nr:hypothetical protein PC112_g11218 [Phytophthora cactorum]KAG2835657.1 hypothetical protein PC111_g5334 [Phytophthora cactorum]KAG3011241.1 hypothetical protein PC119_g13281 [Phytophthora cactorum]KAG3180968.1 hypothetical protein C6341_g6669 [Phytophthora cactorum]